MQPQCPKCTQLWRDYTAVIVTFIDLKGKLQFAALEENAEKIRALSAEAENLSRTRNELRKALRTHQITAHEMAATWG